MPKFKIGERAIIVPNRKSCFGSCYDIKAIEGEIVTITDIDDDGVYDIRDKNGKTHCCEDENLISININRRVV